jgi:hypothetical protein
VSATEEVQAMAGAGAPCDLPDIEHASFRIETPRRRIYDLSFHELKA